MRKSKDKINSSKNHLPIILGIILALFVAGGIFLLLRPDTNEVEELYNNSKLIKSEYMLAGAALIKEAVDENNVRAVIGEEKSNNFEPRILLTRWDGEVEFGVKSDISNIPEQDRTLSSDGNKIILDTPKVKYEMYELPRTKQMRDGGYEFEITLKEKPLTNVVSLDIGTENLLFFYQPPLNQEKQRPGETCTETQCFNEKGEEIRLRPENVVGSYAVYHQKRKAGDYSQVGGKNYKTGKAFHIFRPRIEDSAGKWVWGNLNIDENAGKLTVTIPQEFLDNAAYPVHHAAGLTIGYESNPVSGWTIADQIAANRFQATASGNANPGIMHIYVSSNSGTVNGVFGVYSDNSGTVDSQPKISTTENVITKTYDDGETTWVTDDAFVWTGIIQGTDYWLAINGHDNFRIYYDASGPGYNDSEYDNSTYTGTAPSTFPTGVGADPGTIGIYLTYDAEEGGGSSGWSTTDGQIQVNHGTIRVNHGVIRVNKQISGGGESGSPTPCDLYIDWHTGSDGNAVTDAIAAGSCRPTSPTDIPEAYPGTTLTMMNIEADSASPISGLVEVDGTTYDIGDTTQGAIYDHSEDYEDMVTADVSSNPDVMSMGFMMKTGISGDWLYHCLNGMFGSGDWAALAPRYFSSELHLYVHTSQGYSAQDIVIDNDVWYWITIQYNATAGYAYMAVYNPSTWEQVGSTVSLALGGSPPGIDYWIVGQSSQGGNYEESFTWYGPVIFDWTDGTFPLLPG